FHILSSLPRLFRGNEKYENLTRPQSIEQICDSESLNLGSIKIAFVLHDRAFTWFTFCFNSVTINNYNGYMFFNYFVPSFTISN
nr:hypothetical protein [Salinivirgaceae bacterium]